MECLNKKKELKSLKDMNNSDQDSVIEMSLTKSNNIFIVFIKHFNVLFMGHISCFVHWQYNCIITVNEGG